jgi:membrane protease YdiL (CAAX protease family)
MNRIRTLFALIREPEPAPPWSLGSAALAVLVALAAMIVGTVVALTWVGDQPISELAGWSLGGLVIAVFVWQTRQRQRDALRLQPPQTPIIFIMFVCFGFALALDLLSLGITGQFLPTPELQWLNPAALGVGEWLFAIAFMIIIQPIAEELAFRAIAQPALRALLGAWGGLLATAVITGGFHLLVYPPNYNASNAITPYWYGLALPVIDAVIFGMVRASSKSTRAAIAAHVAFGLFAVVKLLMLTGAPA